MSILLFPEGTINCNDERIGILHDVSAEFEIVMTNNPNHSRTKIIILARTVSIGQWPLPEHFQIEITNSKVTMTLYKCSVIKLSNDFVSNHEFQAVPDPIRNNNWGTIKENKSCL